MQIRPATPQDSDALAQVFFDAVRLGDSPYTELQRAAWMPHPPDNATFVERLSTKTVFVAEVEGSCTGFMTLDPGGYIDLAFILESQRGQGVFRALFAAIEQAARAGSESRIRTHASLMAQPAFQAVGFVILHHETVEIVGQQLSRALMEKHLV
jgi:putative acetyltransferase